MYNNYRLSFRDEHLYVRLALVLVVYLLANRACTMSVSVCSSTSSLSTKYDPDLLKSEVAHARDRVSRLKRELEQIRAEMTCTQRGVETLAS